MSKTYLCPICGFDKLQEEPFSKKNEPSYEICPCCGFEFGFNGENNVASFHKYRKQWIADGASWFMKESEPKNWNYKKQLENVK